MIAVNDVVIWSRTGRPGYTKSGRGRRIELPIRQLARSIDFYSCVFGFRRVDGRGVSVEHGVVLKSTAGTELVLHQKANPIAFGASSSLRWALLVADLDAVRQDVWDLGIKVAHDDGAPDQIYRRPNGRALYIHDPDGNELELVEASPAPQTNELVEWSDAAGRSTQ